MAIGSCLLDRALWIWIVPIGSCLLDPLPHPPFLGLIFPPSLPGSQPSVWRPCGSVWWSNGVSCFSMFLFAFEGCASRHFFIRSISVSYVFVYIFIFVRKRSDTTFQWINFIFPFFQIERLMFLRKYFFVVFFVG